MLLSNQAQVSIADVIMQHAKQLSVHTMYKLGITPHCQVGFTHLS